MTLELLAGSTHPVPNASGLGTQVGIIEQFLDLTHPVGPLPEPIARDRSAWPSSRTSAMVPGHPLEHLFQLRRLPASRLRRRLTPRLVGSPTSTSRLLSLTRLLALARLARLLALARLLTYLTRLALLVRLGLIGGLGLGVANLPLTRLVVLPRLAGLTAWHTGGSHPVPAADPLDPGRADFLRTVPEDCEHRPGRRFHPVLAPVWSPLA